MLPYPGSIGTALGTSAGRFLSNFFNKDKDKETVSREQKKKLEEAAFDKKLADLRGGSLVLNPDGTTGKAEDVDYGPKRRAGDFLERFVTNRFDQNQLLGYNQALAGQDAAFAAERNRQNLETTLAFDRDSPTKQQERQYKAKAGEALLQEAIAKQATSAAQIGGLGTARTFGRGSTSIT